MKTLLCMLIAFNLAAPSISLADAETPQTKKELKKKNKKKLKKKKKAKKNKKAKAKKKRAAKKKKPAPKKQDDDLQELESFDESLDN